MKMEAHDNQDKNFTSTFRQTELQKYTYEKTKSKAYNSKKCGDLQTGRHPFVS